MAKAVGYLEVAAGAVLVATGIGAPIGWGLIVSGAATIYASTHMPDIPEVEKPDQAPSQSLINEVDVYGNLIYGEALVGGALRFWGVTGAHNELLDYVIAHAYTRIEDDGTCLGVEGFGDLYINDQKIAASDIDANGNVTAGVFKGLVQVKSYDGSQTTAEPTLVAAYGNDPDIPWTADAIGKGVVYTWLRVTGDVENGEDFQKAFGSGAPRNVRRVIKGEKVWSPVTGTTAWSDNPALCDRDFLTRHDNGCGFPADIFDDTMTGLSANVCDEVIDYPGTSRTGKRFTLNGVVALGDSQQSTVQKMLTAMWGELRPHGGTLSLVSGSFTESSGIIDESFLRGSAAANEATANDRYNYVTASFVDKNNAYQQMPAPAYPASDSQTFADWQAEDGALITKSVSLPFTDNADNAQVIAQIIGNQSRYLNQLTLECNAKALALGEGERYNVSIGEIGLNGPLYKIVKHQRNPDYSVDLTLQRDDASVWGFDNTIAAEGPYLTPGVPIYTKPPVPTNLAGTEDGLTWTATGAHKVTRYQIWRSDTETGVYEIIDETLGSSWPFRKLDGSTHWWKLRAANGYLFSDYTAPTEVTAKYVESGATKGASIGTNLFGKFDESNVPEFFKTDAIDGPYIKELVVDKLRGGMLGAEFIYVGVNNVVIDGENRRILITDANSVVRVVMGRADNGEFGIWVQNKDGFVTFSADGLTALGTLIDCGGGNYAPQAAADSAVEINRHISPAGSVNVGEYYAPDYVDPTAGPGFMEHRCAHNQIDAYFNVLVNGDRGPVTLTMWANYDGAGFQQVTAFGHGGSIAQECNWRGSFGVAFRYTLKASWNTVEFEFRTDDHTQSMSASVEIKNFVGASVHAAESVSGFAGDASTDDGHTYTLDDLPDSGTRYAAVEPNADKTGDHTAKGATVHNDPTEQGTNRAPSWYRTNYPQAMAVEYKDRSAVAIPSQNASGTTIVLETRVPVDGPIMQAGYTDLGYYVRTGLADDSGWNAWSSTSDNTLSIQGFDNTALTDGAQLGNQASWVQTRDKPTTLSEFGLSELVEPPLPEIQSDEQILVGQSDGSKNWENRLQPGYAHGIITLSQGGGTVGAGYDTFAPYGDTVIIPNPGIPITLSCIGNVNIYGASSGVWIGLEISLDGGATWTSFGNNYGLNSSVGDTRNIPCGAGLSGAPTGDIHIRAVLQVTNADIEIRAADYRSFIQFSMSPFSGVEWYINTAPLAISVDSPVYGSCSRYADNGTTCTASAQVTFSASGGSGGYSYASAITSGPGAITSGASTATPIVSDTATTANPYAQTTTGIHCTVTDSGNQSLTSDTADVILRFQRLYHTISVSVADASCGCSTVYETETCTASGTLSANMSGGNGDLSPSWAKTSGAGAITSGASSTTVHVADTEASAKTVSGTFTCTASDGINPSDSDAGTMTFTFSSVKGYPP